MAQTPDGTAYEIWRQKRGLEREHLFTLHDKRDADIIMKFFADKEEGYGIRSVPSQFGGFSAVLKCVDGSTQYFVSYWVEEEMTDEGIDEGRVKISQDIHDSIAEAMIMGGLEGKARRDAVAYGQPLEQSDGE